MANLDSTVGDSRYELGALVACSESHEVFRGHDRLLRRDVAIKIRRRNSPHTVVRQDRVFEGQVRCLAGIRDRAVVSIFDSVRAPGGRPAMVLEWLPGPTLSARQQSSSAPRAPRGVRPERDGGHGPAAARDEAVRLVTDLSRALVAVHEAGYCHGAVTPEHVIACPDGRFVLIGFGAVRGIAEAGSSTPDQPPQSPAGPNTEWEAATLEGDAAASAGERDVAGLRDLLLRDLSWRVASDPAESVNRLHLLAAVSGLRAHRGTAGLLELAAAAQPPMSPRPLSFPTSRSAAC